jgi:alkanesulfonate monooxygenase SsuD/methylene tetrahydromethanopterin reductase-like flavin-dependent oxidoreductase (luciferase family)
MKVGVGIIPQNYPDWNRDDDAPRLVTDSSLYADALALVERAESLGLDSIWTVEHHFTPYIVVPNPIQFLTYVAGTTRSIDVGTMVTVLPWHHPLRLAAEVAVLDILLGGRKLHLGLGRGTARVEFDAFGIDPTTTRARFAETLEILRLALTRERFSYDGQFYSFSDVTTRPRPRSQGLVDDILMAWGSPESMPIAAHAGLKPIFIPQRAWSAYAVELQRFNAIRAEHGWPPTRPTAAVWMFCAESRAEAEDVGGHYIFEYADSARRHYRLDEPEQFGPGYEHYRDRARSIVQSMHGGEDRKSATANLLRSVAVIGTPDDCMQQLEDIARGLALEHLIGVFQYGSMPRASAERSLDLFSRRVAPRLKQIDIPLNL